MIVQKLKFAPTEYMHADVSIVSMVCVHVIYIASRSDGHSKSLEIVKA